jgi:cytochrome P450
MEFDPFSVEFFENPWDMYRWLRDEAPVYHNERLGFWALSRHEDCVEASRDVATFTSTKGVNLAQLIRAEFSELVGAGDLPLLIMMDPPEHERMRKLVSRAFTPRRVASWEPVVQRVVGRFLDDLAGVAAFDVTRDLAGPFPVEVICEIVGVPEGDRQQIRHWTDAMIEVEVGNPFPTAEGIEASLAFQEYVQELVADMRRRPGGEGMLCDLLEAEVERPDGGRERLSDAEVVGFVILLTAAGSETVTKLVGNGVMTFEEWPDERERLKADPTLAAPAVEECLRWRAPAQYQGRYSLRERELHGVTIPARQPVLLVTGAANRDERAYVDPDRFDITRDGPMGISFGHGIHFCIGAHLARLEGRIAFSELYRRWPDLQVDLAGVQYVHMANVAGPSSVPVAV